MTIASMRDGRLPWRLVKRRGGTFSPIAASGWERWRWRRSWGPSGRPALHPRRRSCESSRASGATQPTLRGANPLAAHPGDFPARAKSVIYLFMAGGPSQLELFDYKPQLQSV